MPALASNGRHADCKSRDPDVSIAGCTSIIEDSRVPTDARAVAYARRALSSAKTDHRGAIHDLTIAIALNQLIVRSDFGRELALNKSAAEFHMYRGREYYNIDDYVRAEVDYDRAIALDANAARPYFLRGVLHATLNRADAALVDLTKAVTLDATYAEAFNYRGQLRAERGDLILALNDLNEAVKLDPENADYHDDLDALQETMGRRRSK